MLERLAAYLAAPGLARRCSIDYDTLLKCYFVTLGDMNSGTEANAPTLEEALRKALNGKP